MGKYREVCFLGNHIMQRISSNICRWKKVWIDLVWIEIWKGNCRTTAKEKKPSYSSHLTRPFETAALISEPPFLCACTNQWRLAGTRQPMGGYFAVSTLLFYFSCDLRQSKKVRTRRRGIPGMNMNTEIMWIDSIILLRLSAFCRQALFVVFLGSVSAVDHLLFLSLTEHRWNRRCSAWILPKEFFQKLFCAFAKTHDADRFSGERGRKTYHPPLRTRREVNTWNLIRMI